MFRPRFLLPLLALALGACDGETLVQCTLASATLRGSSDRLPIAPQHAVRVTVVDSVSGTNLAAGASGAFVTGTYADSLRHDYPTLLTAYGPAGRYGVVVQHPGYAAWGMDDVRVELEECGVETAEVTARMQRPEGAE
jgi:hypothetical protein